MRIWKIKISKGWFVAIIIILAIVAYYILSAAFKNPLSGYITETVVRGDVVQEVSETGSVKAAEDISLGFKSVGKIAAINVAVGSNVKKGDILAELDASQIRAQLQSAKAALNYATNQYNSGVAAAKDDLQSSYDTALNNLSDAYTKVYNAYNVVVSLRNAYFSAADQPGLRVASSKDDISQNMQNIKQYLDAVQETQQGQDIDSAISEYLIALNNIANDLGVIRQQCDQGIYYSAVSAADKTSLDTQKTYINTALTNITTSQTSISSYKITLQKAYDSANNSGAGDSVSGAQVEQAQANVNLYQSQLNDSYLVAPANGKITQINTKKGETVSPAETLITLLSAEPFQIKVPIYEQDIVNVEVGDNVKIDLVPFPDKVFNGKVLLVDPAETIIDNVVYYNVTIDLPDQPEGIKSGMTADITIEANKKENILRVPENAVENIDGEYLVQIVRGKNIESKSIKVGLEGNDYYEVISGLNEGDVIITGNK